MLAAMARGGLAIFTICSNNYLPMARVFFASGLDQHIADLRIISELLRPLQQPDIELAFGGAQVRGQFRVITLGIVHQKSRMHLEKLCQQRA